jgi:ureidoacrylate peracid hydrolase
VHPNELPAEIVDRLRTRRGKLHLFERIEAQRSALAVIDMQHAFVDPGAPSAVPTAREIVPNINRLAAALRRRGGTVAWVQATYTREGPGYWPLFFDYMVTPELSGRILGALTEGAPGHALWAGLDVQPQDLRVRKNRYSAFFPGACELPQRLRARSIDTVLIAGTMTNVCCEASARDAMMDGFKTIIVSDANAARSDAEHVASLATILQFFGDVRTTSEVIALL